MDKENFNINQYNLNVNEMINDKEKATEKVNVGLNRYKNKEFFNNNKKIQIFIKIFKENTLSIYFNDNDNIFNLKN